MNASQRISAVFLAILTPLFSNSAFSQPNAGMGGEVTLNSTVLGEERVLSISLPQDYATSDRRYPVLYVLDGRAHQQHANSAVDFLARYGKAPQMIVVAVYNVDRTRDFSPVHDETMPASGGAGKFLQFVAGELVPYIADHYRESGFSVIMGHSFGGTFVTYTLLENPGLFDAYISLSPYLQYADNHVVKQAAETLEPGYGNGAYFYMTVGDEPDYYSPLGEFHALLEENSGQAMDIEYARMETEDHSSVPYLGLFNGLRHVFADWVLPGDALQKGVAAVDVHYKGVAARYGLSSLAPENVLNRLGYTLLGNHEIDQAIEVFTENTLRYPQSANVYDSLGDAYRVNGQLDLARDSYARAYELARAQNHVNTAVYKANLERVSQNLAE